VVKPAPTHAGVWKEAEHDETQLSAKIRT